MWKKADNKKTGEELQAYLAFHRKGSRIESKKKYNRKEKHRKRGKENEG